MIWLNIGLSWKITKIRSTPLFFKIELCSATSMESSRRDLFNNMAEHRPIFKNNQNTHCSLIFQDGAMFSHINGKLSPRPFEWYGYLGKQPNYVPLPFWFHPTGIALPKTGVLFLQGGAFPRLDSRKCLNALIYRNKAPSPLSLFWKMKFFNRWNELG